MQSLIPPFMPITPDIPQSTCSAPLAAPALPAERLPVPREVRIHISPSSTDKALSCSDAPQPESVSHQRLPVPAGLPEKSGPCHDLHSTRCPGISEKEGAEDSRSCLPLPLQAQSTLQTSAQRVEQNSLTAAPDRSAWDLTPLPQGGSLEKGAEAVKMLSLSKAIKLQPFLCSMFPRTNGRLFQHSEVPMCSQATAELFHKPLGPKVLGYPLSQTLPAVALLPLNSAPHCQRGPGHQKIPVGA